MFPPGSRGPGPRTAVPGGTSRPHGVLSTLEVLAAVMPPKLKLELSEQLITWATAKRNEARASLGIEDPEPPPTYGDGRPHWDTRGEPG